jgi:AcrR family transcriptional regulator
MTRETTGYQGLSLDAVAREAGIKKPTLYHHFPGGKETIYAEVAHDFIETQHTALFLDGAHGNVPTTS